MTTLTILAKHAVRYPLPEPTSRAEAPSVNLSLRISRACACYTGSDIMNKQHFASSTSLIVVLQNFTNKLDLPYEGH